MKLSVAIRLGAMMKPQMGTGWGDYSGTCALYAALDAIGRDYVNGTMEAAIEWPILNSIGHVCPDCQESKLTAWKVVALHLNDRHRWTRERIADWVEMVEMAQDCKVAELVEVRS